jgi:hypothetical protein
MMNEDDGPELDDGTAFIESEKGVPPEDELDEFGYAQDENGELVDRDGDKVFCEICENLATATVKVSEEKPHDGTHTLCSTCYNAYLVGVQHGRHHEAARHGTTPGRDSSQDKPK